MKKTWRIVIACLSIIYIMGLWIKKDIVSIYANVPKEEMISVFFTTILVSLFKVVFFAGIILLVKWMFVKIRKK